MRTSAEVVRVVPQPDHVLPRDTQSRRGNNIPPPARTPPARVSRKNAAPKCRVFLAVPQTHPTHTCLRAWAPAVASQECSLPTVFLQAFAQIPLFQPALSKPSHS